MSSHELRSKPWVTVSASNSCSGGILAHGSICRRSRCRLSSQTSARRRELSFCFAAQLAVLLNDLTAAELGSAIQTSFNKLKSLPECSRKFDMTSLLNKQKPMLSGFAGDCIQDLSYNAKAQSYSKYHGSLVIYNPLISASKQLWAGRESKGDLPQVILAREKKKKRKQNEMIAPFWKQFEALMSLEIPIWKAMPHSPRLMRLGGYLYSFQWGVLLSKLSPVQPILQHGMKAALNRDKSSVINCITVSLLHPSTTTMCQ